MQLSELADEHEEARWVAGEIERLGEEEGVRREDVAVFYRTNAMSRVLEDTLVRFELPYQVIGGTKFYERAEIKDAVAYLSLLVNPSDQVSLRARRQLAAARDRQNQPGRGSSRTPTPPACRSGRSPAQARRCPGWARRRSRRSLRFHETMEGLRGTGARTRPVAELLRGDCLRETGYLDALEAERTVEAEGRAENLEELVGVAAEFDANRELEGEGETSRRWRSSCSRSRSTPSRTGSRDESVITLMTLHNAKGLEYDTVFIVGCEDGAFPHMRALEEGGEEEERRLCYVGITRARRRLYMTWTRERRLFGRAERNLPSRFVDELPAELTERQLERAAGAVRRRRLALGPARRRSTPGRRSSCGPATTSSTPASATASSPRSSPAAWSSSASPATAPSAS